MSTFVNNILGQADPFVPGFISTYSSQFTTAVFWGPVALQVITTTFQARKKIDDIKKNYVKILAAGIVTTAGVAYTVYATRMGIINPSQIYQAFKAIPFVQTLQTYIQLLKTMDQLLPQSQILIVGIYSSLGVLHSLKPIFFKNDRDADNVKNVFSACIGLGTAYMMQTGRIAAVWSSSAAGLLLLLPNLQAVNLIGTMLVNDSILDWVKPNRDPYDFTAIIINNLNPMITQLTYCSGVQLITDRFFG